MNYLKKYILLLLGIIFLFSGCVEKEKTNDEVVDYFKNIKTYKCDAVINLFNDRQSNQYSCKLYYDENKGNRIEIGSDRVQVYKDKSIYVEDKISNQKYTLSEDFDKVFSLSFLNKYIRLIYVNEDIKYNIKEENGRKYQLIQLDIPENNVNMVKAVLMIDIKTLEPQYLTIYDNKDKERVRVEYSSFEADNELDAKLFET